MGFTLTWLRKTLKFAGQSSWVLVPRDHVGQTIDSDSLLLILIKKKKIMF